MQLRVSHKREAEGDSRIGRRGEGSGTREAEIGVMLPQASEYQQPSEAGRRKEWVLCRSLRRECCPANTRKDFILPVPGL